RGRQRRSADARNGRLVFKARAQGTYRACLKPAMAAPLVAGSRANEYYLRVGIVPAPPCGRSPPSCAAAHARPDVSFPLHRTPSSMKHYRVGIAGFGAIGQAVARALDAGIPGLTLAALGVRDPQRRPDAAWRGPEPARAVLADLAPL